VQVLADLVGHDQIVAQRRRDVRGEQSLPHICGLHVLDRNGMERDRLLLLLGKSRRYRRAAMLRPGCPADLDPARQQHFPQRPGGIIRRVFDGQGGVQALLAEGSPAKNPHRHATWRALDAGLDPDRPEALVVSEFSRV
jgi:hypothetical protein